MNAINFSTKLLGVGSFAITTITVAVVVAGITTPYWELTVAGLVSGAVSIVALTIISMFVVRAEEREAETTSVARDIKPSSDETAKTFKFPFWGPREPMAFPWQL